MSNLNVCHHCPNAKRTNARTVACSIDGKDIIQHAKSLGCPAGRFDQQAVQVTTKAAQMTKEQQGAAAWSELHTRAFAVTDLSNEAAWVAGWLARVPCGTCKQSGAALIKQYPPDLSSPEAYQRWGVLLHNRVNADLGKPQWTFEQVVARWTPTKEASMPVAPTKTTPRGSEEVALIKLTLTEEIDGGKIKGPASLTISRALANPDGTSAMQIRSAVVYALPLPEPENASDAIKAKVAATQRIRDGIFALVAAEMGNLGE